MRNVAKVFIGLSIAYFSAIAILNALFELKILNIYNYCLLGNRAAEEQNIVLNISMIWVPLILMVFFTVVYDLKSFSRIKTQVYPYFPEGSHLEKTSFFATVSSTLMIIPYVLYVAVLSNLFPNLTSENKYYFIMVPATIINIIRNPLTALFAYKSLQKSESSQSTPVTTISQVISKK